MYPLPAQDAAAILDQLTKSRTFGVKIYRLDQNENVLDRINNRLLEGSVQVDADSDVNRALSLTFLDPQKHLWADGTSYASQFVQVYYIVKVPDGVGGWRDVDIPVFCGPITGFARNGPQVMIEAQSKEALLLDPCVLLNPVGIWWDVPLQQAINQLMADTGETKIALNALAGQVTRNGRTYMPGDERWKALRGGNVGTALGGHTALPIMADCNPPFFLLYDAAGWLTVRPMNTGPLWTFDGEMILTAPDVTYDALSFRNHARVESDNPNGGPPFVGEYSLPPTHPFSPQALARNGVPRYLSIIESDSSFVSSDACAQRAQQLVAESSFAYLDAAFQCLPVPHLEPNDVCQVNFRGDTFTFRLKTFTLPLTADSPMTIGVTTTPAQRFDVIDYGTSYPSGRLHAKEQDSAVFTITRELVKKRKRA